MRNFSRNLFSFKRIATGGLLAVIGGLGYQVATIAQDDAWTAHEWGTYTSVQGSDGSNQPGLHHGDEALPRFVHCPGGSSQSYSGCLSLLSPGQDPNLIVTQRLETPVIYFHSKKARDIRVEVDFPQGVFTEWYPTATSFLPEAGHIQAIRNGTMSWNASLAVTPLEVPTVYPDEIWAPSRTVQANALTVGGENEQFIFYRGIGKFDPAFRVTSDEQGTLAVTNSSAQPITAAFLLQVKGGKGAFQRLPAIPAGGSIAVAAPTPLDDKSPTQDAFIASVGPALKGALVSSGLNDDEAQAMVDTWTRSYFKTDGTRILYLAPRAWTDAILPIRFTPAPTDLVRTLVGRVEILSRSDEQALLEQLKAALAGPTPDFPAYDLGRFAEPQLWRAYALATEPALKEFIAKIIREQLAGT